jgi:ATP:corrinoid adenosyltransferase
MDKNMFADLDDESISQTDSIKVEKPKTASFSENIGNKKPTIVIYGDKGKGKTTAAYSLIRDNEKVLVISADGMSDIIAKEFFTRKNIEIYNTNKYDMIVIKKLPNGQYESMISMEAGNKNAQELIIKLQELKEDEYDWLVVDGMNVLEQNLAEAVMRFKYSLQISDGVKNLSWWRDRSNYINFLFDICLKKAKKGVIYTLYPKIVEKKMTDGEVLEKEEFPHYAADLMYKTLIVLRVDNKKVKGEQRYFVDVITSKLARIKTGDVIDYTGKNLYDLVKI